MEQSVVPVASGSRTEKQQCRLQFCATYSISSFNGVSYDAETHTMKQLLEGTHKLQCDIPRRQHMQTGRIERLLIDPLDLCFHLKQFPLKSARSPQQARPPCCDREEIVKYRASDRVSGREMGVECVYEGLEGYWGDLRVSDPLDRRTPSRSTAPGLEVDQGRPGIVTSAPIPRPPSPLSLPDLISRKVDTAVPGRDRCTKNALTRPSSSIGKLDSNLGRQLHGDLY